MTKRLITPEYAQQLIDECKHDDALMDTLMRPIRPHHVNYLARQMERKAFGNNIIDIAHCKETDQRFIVNGNHTLRALIQSQAQLYLTVEHTTCETIHDVRLAYQRYDRGLMRSRKDSLRSLNSVGDMDLPLSSVGYLAAAVAFLVDDYGSTRVSKMMGDDELYEESIGWADEYKAIREIVGGSKQWEARIIRRRSVLSVAMVTIRAEPEKARKFWTGVVTGVDIPDKSPILRLRDFLVESNMLGGGTTKNPQYKPEAMAKVVAYCWDKYVTGKPLVQLRVPDRPPTVYFSSSAAGELVPA